MIAVFSGCVEETHAAEKAAYLIPVKITNNGEASARDFDVNLYLDRKSVTVLNIPELAGQNSIEDNIRVEAQKGEHTLSVKVDEHNNTIESNEDNNEFEKKAVILLNLLLLITPVQASYAGDKPLQTVIYDKHRGGLDFSLGDSRYSGELEYNESYRVNFSVEPPAGSSIKVAKAYVYWVWSKKKGLKVSIRNLMFLL